MMPRSIRFRIALSLGTAILLLAVMSLPAAALDPVVVRYAGSGDFSYKDGPLLEAAFRFPAGVTVDAAGNILLADTQNHCIRKLTATGVTTIAGSASGQDAFGFPRGELVDGPIGQARFNQPRGIAVDTTGNIFVADTGNHVIRKITGDTVYTFTGTGLAGWADGGPREAQFNSPAGLTIDAANNLYVTDTLNHVIRRITPRGEVSTIAGVSGTDGGYLDGTTAVARFNEPVGIALSGTAVLVLDSGNQMIRKIENGQVTTLAGAPGLPLPQTTYLEGGYADGKAAAARFNFPKGITILPGGTIVVADTWNHRIRALTPDGNVITLTGTGTAGETNGTAYAAEFNGPAGLVWHAGRLYITDLWNNSLRVLAINPDQITPRLDLEPDPSAIQLWLDGNKLTFPTAVPFPTEAGILVPLRSFGEQWGAYVEWSQNDGSLLLAKAGWSWRIDSRTSQLVLRDGRSYLELEYLASQLGLSVEPVPGFTAFLLTTPAAQ